MDEIITGGDYHWVSEETAREKITPEVSTALRGYWVGIFTEGPAIQAAVN